MGTLLDLASLVTIPSGYKVGTVYSVVPTDGAGDLSFTRSNDTATRVGPNGLIEKVRTNVVLQSNTFSNASWSKTNQGVGSVAVVTPNYTTDPFGGNNAWRFQCNLNGGTTANDRSWMLQSFTSFANSVLSIYIKLNVAGSKTIIFSNGGGDAQTITSTDWVRITKAQSTASGEFRIGLIGGSTSDTLDCSIAFAQAETGDIATDYIATTTTAVSVGPVANLPRLDYLNSTCPNLLLEPQRTNSAEYSEQTDNAWWFKFQCTITANQTIAPDGYASADLFTTSSSNAVIYRTSLTAGALSFFAKVGTLNANAKFAITVDGVGGAYWNQNGTLVSVTGGTASNGVNYGNGWYRFNYNVTSGSVINYGLSDVTGTGTCYIWGIQNEASATYATSYIPTLGAASTRGVDLCSKTGISSLIGQTEGTMFVEINTFGFNNFDRFIALSNGSNNRIGLIRNSTNNQLYFFVELSGTLIINVPGISGTNVLGRHKIAAGYKSGDYVVYMDGVQVYTSNASSVPTTSQLFLGTSEDGITENTMSGTINEAILFPTRLSNAEIAQLTTL